MSIYWPKDWVSEEQQLCEPLKRWQGAHTVVWEYMVSHGRLLIRLSRPEGETSTYFYLYCASCERVEFAGSGKADIHLTSTQGERAGRPCRLYTVTDGNHLRVECRGILGVETGRVLWLPRPLEMV